MLESIKAYIKIIAIFMIFISFVEMLFPENNFKKFINIFMGFMIVAVVLNPISNLKKYNFSFDRNISSFYTEEEVKEFAYSQYLEKIRKEVEIDIYNFSNEKQNIKEPNVIVDINENNIKDIEITIYCDTENYNIDKLSKYLYEKYGAKIVIINNK